MNHESSRLPTRPDGRSDLLFGPAGLHPAGVLPGQGESGSSTQFAK